MQDLVVKKAPLPFWAAGLLLGIVQIIAIAAEKPIGVSTQFVVLDAKVIHNTAPDYAQKHPLIRKEKYRKFGYGFWLDIGILIGGLAAALTVNRFKPAIRPAWSKQNGHSRPFRIVTAFIGGFLILLGARMAHGCTSGQLASGLAQLAVSSVPFMLTLFAFAMLTAYLVYPKTPILPDREE